MAGSLAYVDTSAYLKLVFAEEESEAFEVVVSEWPDLVSSELLEVEMHRAFYRAGLPAPQCSELLEAVNLVELSEPIRAQSLRIGQPQLRAADAIHLATAASLGPELGVLFAYDKRCSKARCSRAFRRGHPGVRRGSCVRAAPPSSGSSPWWVRNSSGVGAWRVGSIASGATGSCP